MEKHITHTKALSRFIQLLDGNFPSGSFVHSFGLEPYIVLKKVKDADDLKHFLKNIIIDQYQKLEFVYAKKVFSLLEKNRVDLLISEDEKYSAMLNYEYAKASSDLGENYLRHIFFDIKKNAVKVYFDAVKKKKAVGNEVVVLSAYAYELELDVDTFLLLWCKKNMINIASASLKISRIKPSEIQKLLFAFDEVLEKQINAGAKRATNFNPLFEEVIFRHQYLEPKLFVT